MRITSGSSAFASAASDAIRSGVIQGWQAWMSESTATRSFNPAGQCGGVSW
jgi:hypothetical protein